MTNKNSNEFITIIIYFLVILLMCLILYNLFLIINQTYSSPQSHGNSIKVGPIFLE